jgi:hypothetical protein
MSQFQDLIDETLKNERLHRAQRRSNWDSFDEWTRSHCWHCGANAEKTVILTSGPRPLCHRHLHQKQYAGKAFR